MKKTHVLTFGIKVLTIWVVVFLASVHAMAEEPAAPLTYHEAQKETESSSAWGRQGARILRNGQPWYPVGYYPGLHSLTFKSPPPGYGIDYQQLIDQLAANQINLLRCILSYNLAIEGMVDGSVIPYELYYPYKRSTSTSLDTYHATTIGIPNRKKFDLNVFDPNFFSHWDNIISYAKSKGIVVQAVLFETHHIDSSTSNGTLPIQGFHRAFDFYAGGGNVNGINILGPDDWYVSNPGNCASQPRQTYCYQRAYVRKVVEELCHHENIIWEIANEPQEDRADWLQAMAGELRAMESSIPACAQHKLIMMPDEAGFDLPDHRDVPGHFTPGQRNSDGDYVSLRNGIAAKYFSDGRPMIADNDCCFTPGSAEQQRKKAWTALVAGAHPSLFQYDMEILGPQHPNNQQRLAWVGNTRRFLEQFEIELLGMEPDDNRIQTLSGGPAWLLGQNNGQTLIEGVVYFFRGGSARLFDLPSSLNATWFNPRTLATQTAVPSGDVFDTPSSEDWVLHFKPGQQTLEIQAAADSFISEKHPTRSFGLKPILRINALTDTHDRAMHSFISFNIPEFQGQVISAKLTLTTWINPIPEAGFFEMHDMKWRETKINWDNYLSGGVTFTFMRDVFNLQPFTSYEIDVTEAVDGPGNITIGIATAIDSIHMAFHSRQNSNLEFRPKLVVTYQE